MVNHSVDNPNREHLFICLFIYFLNTVH